MNNNLIIEDFDFKDGDSILLEYNPDGWDVRKEFTKDKRYYSLILLYEEELNKNCYNNLGKRIYWKFKILSIAGVTDEDRKNTRRNYQPNGILTYTSVQTAKNYQMTLLSDVKLKEIPKDI